MAEQVQVRGGGVEFDNAIFENAATEATLLRVAEALEAQQKGTAQKVLGMHTAAVNANIKAQQGSSNAANSFTKTLDDMNSAGQEMINTFSKIIGIGLGTTFALIQTAGEGLIGFLKNGFDAFQQVAQVGATFNNNLIELRKTAAGALIPIGEFTELIIKNSETLAALGGSVTNGAKVFSDVAKVFNEEYSQQLIGAGYSLSQMNDSIMAYLDLQTRLGKVDNRNINTITKGTRDYMQELDQVTKLTGMSRKQAEEAVKKASMDPILNSMMRSAKDQAKAQANMATLAQVGGDQALEMIKSMATRNPSEEARLLMTQTGATMEEARDILTGGIGSEETLKKMKNYANVLEQQGMLTDEYAEIMMGQNPAMANLIKTMMQFQRMTDADLSKIAEEQKARDAITSVFGNIGKALNNIYNKFIIKLTESRSFQILQQKLEDLANNFEKYEPAFEKFADLLVSTFTGAMDHFLENLETEGVIRALIDLFKDLFKGIKDNVFPSAKALLYGLFGKTPGEGPPTAQSKGLPAPGSPDETSQQKFLREQGVPAQQTNTDLGFDFGPLTDGLKAITDYIPSLTQFASYFGVAGGGAYVAGMGLAAGITKVGSAITKVLIGGLYELGPALASLTVASEAIPVILSLGGAAAGLGYAFNGISNIIDAVFNSFAKVKDFFTSMQDLDREKLRGVGEAMMPITSQLTEIGKGAIYNLIGGGGLTNLADSLQKMGGIDYSKLDGAGPSLKSLHDGLALFTQGGVLDNWGESISSWFGGGKIDNIFSSLTKFASIDFSKLAASEKIPTAISTLQESINNLNIDQGKLDNLAGVSDKLKTAFGGDLDSSTTNVNNFTTSINKLIESLSKLEDQMKKTPKVGDTTVGDAKVAQPNNTSAPTISSDDPQRQLNMKFDQMIELLTQMKDNTKDAADSLNNRRGAL